MDEVREKLLALGLPSAYRGFSFLARLLSSYTYDEAIGNSFYSILESLSEHFGVRINTVENGFITLLRHAFKDSENAQLRMLFPGYTRTKLPTVKTFIFTMLFLFGDQKKLLSKK